VGRDGHRHHRNCRGRGPGILGKIRRDNVGKVLMTSGGWSKLQGPADEPERRRKREASALAHEAVVAMMER
jgi:hypothetical protein